MMKKKSKRGKNKAQGTQETQLNNSNFQDSDSPFFTTVNFNNLIQVPIHGRLDNEDISEDGKRELELRNNNVKETVEDLSRLAVEKLGNLTLNDNNNISPSNHHISHKPEKTNSEPQLWTESHPENGTLSNSEGTDAGGGPKNKKSRKRRLKGKLKRPPGNLNSPDPENVIENSELGEVEGKTYETKLTYENEKEPNELTPLNDKKNLVSSYGNFELETYSYKDQGLNLIEEVAEDVEEDLFKDCNGVADYEEMKKKLIPKSLAYTSYLSTSPSKVEEKIPEVTKPPQQSTLGETGGLKLNWSDGNPHEFVLCQIPSCRSYGTKKCSSCKAAFYCGEDHQKADWKRHKNNCTPYKMQVNESGYSVAVAVRNLHAGQLIFDDNPLLIFPVVEVDDHLTHVMNAECIDNFPDDCSFGEKWESGECGPSEWVCSAKSPVCLGCFKTAEFVDTPWECSKCSLPLCSANCEYGIPHQLGECSAILNLGIKEKQKLNRCYHSLYLDIEILRALLLENWGNGKWEGFLQLQGHVRVETYKRSEEFSLFKRKWKSLVPISANFLGYNADLILNVHATITALSFKPYLMSTYKVLYGVQLLFAHQCIPNTVSFIEEGIEKDFDKPRLVTKAAVPILKGDFITIDFCPTPYLPYLMRGKMLRSSSIECTCQRCVDPLSVKDFSGAMACLNCTRGLVSPEDPTMWDESVWSCNSCQEEFPFSLIARREEGAYQTLLRIPKSFKGLDRLSEYVFKYGVNRELNPTHYLVIMAWCFIERILNLRISNDRSTDFTKVYEESVIRDFQLLLKYCEACEPHLTALRPGISIDRGILLYNKFFAQAILSSRDFQNKRLGVKEYVEQLQNYSTTLKTGLQMLMTFKDITLPTELESMVQEGMAALVSLESFTTSLTSGKK